MLVLLDVVTRAAYLLFLALVPPLSSPEPAPSTNPVAPAIVAAVALAAVLYGALRLRAFGAGEKADGPRPMARGLSLSAALLWVSVAASIGAALYFREARAPLGRGVAFVAVPLWGAITLGAATVAGERLKTIRNAKTLAALVVIGAAALLYAPATKWLGSPQKMWWEALRRDGEHGRAIGELTRAATAKKDRVGALAIVDECLRMHPTSCRCQAEKAEIAIRSRAFEEALQYSQAAEEKCSGDLSLRALHAEALGLAGKGVEAEEASKRALAVGGPEGRLRYALALGLAAQGKQAEALTEAKAAVALGAGRGAALFVGAAALVKGDLDEAQKVLAPLVAADPSDAEAVYDIALIADRRGDYNGARSGYLAALRLDPSLADARYNLAVLTQKKGVFEEAKHHARKFAEAYPNDPRGADLARIVGLK